MNSAQYQSSGALDINTGSPNSFQATSNDMGDAFNSARINSANNSGDTFVLYNDFKTNFTASGELLSGGDAS